MILWFRHERKNDADRALEHAIACWKESVPPERLSEGARGRILRQAVETQEMQPVPTRLRSAAWRILASALPVAVIGLFAIVLADRTGESDHALRIRATKAGGEVIFSIANGRSTHSVYKSNDPNGFGTAARLTVHGGSFRDAVDDESGLVFYRIE
jgi:hypothetical protein